MQIEVKGSETVVRLTLTEYEARVLADVLASVTGTTRAAKVAQSIYAGFRDEGYPIAHHAGGYWFNGALHANGERND